MPRRRLTNAELQLRKRRNEEIYAAVACEVLGARWRRIDVPGGAPGLRDFDFVFPDEHVEALEICAFTEDAAEAQRAALEGNRRLVTWEVRRVWLVYVPYRGLDVGELLSGRLWPRIEASIAALESHGYERVATSDLWSLRLGRSTPPLLAQAARTLDNARDGVVSSGHFGRTFQ